MTSESVESLYDLIDYLFDKMHIQVEMTEQQIVSFASQFSSKVISWVILSNTLKIIVCILILLLSIIVLRKILKKYNIIYKIKTGFKDEASSTMLEKSFIYVIILAVVVGIQIILLIKCIGYTSKIVQCGMFPEKVVLDFINNYL